MALTTNDYEAIAAWATMRARGLSFHAAVAAVNLARVMAEQPELDEALVAKLKRLAP